MGSVAELGVRNIRGMFYEALSSAKGIAWVEAISNLFTSDQESETYKWLTQAPMMREWVSGRQKKQFTTQGITIENLEFEATVGIRGKDLRRDKTDQIMIRLQDLVKRSYTHWAKLLTALIVNGTSLRAYDGQYFYSASHEEGSSGVMSNLLTVSDYAELGTPSTASNPTVDQMADIVIKVIQHMYSFKDDQGEPRNEDAMDFRIMVPTNLYGVTAAACKSLMLSSASGSRDNPVLAQEFSVKPVQNARLSSTTEIYAFRTDAAAKALIRQSETEVNPEILGPGSDHWFKEKEMLVGIDATRNVGLGMWWQSVKATIS